MKIAVVGAGSTYTPELVDGLIRMRGLLPVDELALLDTDPERLGILAGMTRRMLARGGWELRVDDTTDLDRAHRMARRWKAGTVWINTFFERDLRLPFGGEGASGLGREGGRYSQDFFTEPRAVTIRLRS